VKRVLFVDDEPQILDGLRDLLRPQRHEWEMRFAPGPEAALAELEAEHFDVVVSDMRMPVMDGATLLTRIRERWPHVVRIILSGHTEVEAALRAVPVAHQFLAKPCRREVLVEVVERARNLQELLADESVRTLIAEAESLPSLPDTYARLTHVLSDPDCTARDVALVIEQDIAMCAKVLQLVNSAFFGLGRRITSITEGVTYLGLATTKSLVMSVEVFSTFSGVRTRGEFSLQTLQRHAMLVSRLAARLLPDAKEAEDAAMAGMLHDIGKLILCTYRGDEFYGLVARAQDEGVALHRLEKETGGATHAEIGGYLLGLWGLPNPVVEAVACHHEPSRVGSQAIDVLTAVHVANALAHQYAPAPGHGDGELDEAYLESIGATERLPEWRGLAERQLEIMTEAA
jgi:HD-like signal output (HDOD) protein